MKKSKGRLKTKIWFSDDLLFISRFKRHLRKNKTFIEKKIRF
ncbi:hypothetical protein HMPREF3156_00268 [Neisseria sp. HMSC06F02]|nr:hypothetical protein HMPREF3156_00268 [Neisseria sp. HMSC06F02]